MIVDMAVSFVLGVLNAWFSVFPDAEVPTDQSVDGNTLSSIMHSTSTAIGTANLIVPMGLVLSVLGFSFAFGAICTVFRFVDWTYTRIPLKAT